jgi:hypothetical protein
MLSISGVFSFKVLKKSSKGKENFCEKIQKGYKNAEFMASSNALKMFSLEKL